MNKLQLRENLGIKSLFIAGIIMCISVSGFLVYFLIQSFQHGTAIQEISTWGTPVFWFFFFLAGSVGLGILDAMKIIGLFRGRKRDGMVSFLIPINMLTIIIFVALLSFTIFFGGMGNHE